MNLLARVPKSFLLIVSVSAALQSAYSEMRPLAAWGGKSLQAKRVFFDPGTRRITLRYELTGSTVRPWKGVLAFGGWPAGKATLDCAPKRAVAIVNGLSDNGANSDALLDEKVQRAAHCTVKMSGYPGADEVAPPVVLEGKQRFREAAVPGNRESAGKRSQTLRETRFV